MARKHAEVGAGVDKEGVFGNWIKDKQAAGSGGAGGSRYCCLPWWFKPWLPLLFLDWKASK